MSSATAVAASEVIFIAERRPTPRYVEDVIRAAVVLTVFWGIAAFLAGVVIAAQLVWPQLSFDSPHLTFGRLRPLHTSAAIFAFGGTALVGTAFHVVQRTCRARLFGGAPLGWFVLLGYQFFIVIAATGELPAAIRRSLTWDCGSEMARHAAITATGETPAAKP